MSKFVKYGVISLVVISFFFFGIYGVITSQKSYVAKIDGEKISAAKFQSYLSNRKQNILGQKPTPEVINLIASKQFERIMLNEMINSIVIHKFLKDNGLHITEKVSAAYVKTLQNFNKEGNFDSQYFQKYLEYIDTTEKEFLKSYIPKIEEVLFTNITNGIKISMPSIARQHIMSQKKERNFDILLLKHTKPFEYKEEELLAYYQTIKQQFTQGTKHIVTISYIDDYITQNIKIFHSTPKNIAEYYNNEYMGKNIKLKYAIFQDKETAQTAHSLAKKQGISLQNIVDTILSKTPNSIIKHGNENSSNIENSEILLSLKNLTKNSVTPVIQLQNGYYLAQVTEVQNKTFSQDIEEKNISENILKQRKCNNITIFTDKISQDLQSGISYEGVSLKYGFPISQEVIIDSATKTVTHAHTNTPVNIDPNLLQNILQNKDTKYGHVINLDKTKCSFAIYKQTNIEQERILSLSEVRGKVLEMYKDHKKLQDQQKEAKVIESNVKSLKNNLLSYQKHGSFANLNLNINNNISPELFTKPIGTTFAVTGQNGNVYVITINSQQEYTGTITNAEIMQAKKEIENIYYNTFLQEWLKNMYDKYDVKIYI